MWTSDLPLIYRQKNKQTKNKWKLASVGKPNRLYSHSKEITLNLMNRTALYYNRLLNQSLHTDTQGARSPHDHKDHPPPDRNRPWARSCALNLLHQGSRPHDITLPRLQSTNTNITFTDSFCICATWGFLALNLWWAPDDCSHPERRPSEMIFQKGTNLITQRLSWTAPRFSWINDGRAQSRVTEPYRRKFNGARTDPVLSPQTGAGRTPLPSSGYHWFYFDPYKACTVHRCPKAVYISE